MPSVTSRAMGLGKGIDNNRSSLVLEFAGFCTPYLCECVPRYIRAKPDVLLRAILQYCDAMLQY